MFYLRAATGLSDDLSQVFGTTMPIENIPPKQPTVFHYTESPRDMFLEYRITKVYPEEGKLNVSPSVVCEARSKKEQVIYKIFFMLDDEKRFSLQRLLYESQVYRYITMNLSWVTRCFVPWHATYMFKAFHLDATTWNEDDLVTFRDTLKKSGNYEAFKAFYAVFGQQKSVNTVFAQVTRRMSGDKTLLDYMNEKFGLLFNIAPEVLFQVIFALAVMGEMKIQHNDLHIGNILIREIKKQLHGYYFKGSLFWVEQTVQISIFDWDQAYVESLKENYGLNDKTFEEEGIGNVFNPRYDIYNFLSSIENFYHDEPPPQLSDVLKFARPTKFEKSPIKLCNVVEEKCAPFETGQPESVKLPHVLLQTLPLFQSYRKEGVAQRTSQKGIVRFDKPDKPSFFGTLFK